MSQRRVVRIISYEGNEDFIEETLGKHSRLRYPGHTFFTPKGTIKCLREIELREGETLASKLGTDDPS